MGLSGVHLLLTDFGAAQHAPWSGLAISRLAWCSCEGEPLNRRVGLLPVVYGHDPDFEAEITFLTTDEGGRKGYALSGYRPQFFYEGEDHDAIQEFVDKERVYPGETVTVQLHLLNPELLRDALRVNDHFQIREGLRTVGRGKVTRILKLEENAATSNR